MNHRSIVSESELECALLNFAITYKNKVLTVDEMFFLGESLMKESDEESCKALKDFFSNEDTEFKHQYHMVAQLSGQQTMNEVLEILSHKIFANLLTSTSGDKSENKQLIDLSLQVFNMYLANKLSCRQLVSLPVVKELATSHIANFNILQKESQLKQLC